MGGIAQLPQGWQGWLTPILIQFFAHLCCFLPTCHLFLNHLKPQAWNFAILPYWCRRPWLHSKAQLLLLHFFTITCNFYYHLWSLIAIMILLTVKEETCNSRNGLILMRMVSCCWVVLEIFCGKYWHFPCMGTLHITRASDEFIRTFVLFCCLM